MDQINRQISLPEHELGRIANRIDQDFFAARSNHDMRIERFRRYYRMWRGISDARPDKDGNVPFEVPMLKWITFGHWSRCMQAMLGDDAEIVAAARTPESQKIAKKVGIYQTWRWFEYMKAIPELSAWLFRAVLNGRAHAELIYEQEYYWERQVDGTDKEVMCYDGPRLRALWPSDIVLPAQDGIGSVDQFDWKIRRLRLTPQQLIDGERRGRYQGIVSHWSEIMAYAEMRQERDFVWDDEKIDADLAEGVSHGAVLGNRDSIEMWQWYGQWRLPRGKQDSRPENLMRRHPQQSELLVSYLPRLHLIVGVQDRRDIYPRSRKRDPFVDIGLVKDGSYWCPGLGEMIEELQDESTANYKIFQTAGQFSVGPLIFYRPQGGFDPKTQKYGPFTAIPTEDPAGVQIVRMPADFKYTEMNQQWLKAVAELVSAVSDQTLGQSIDRPNAPRTATGQMALIEQGNVRASLDMNMLREDLSVAIEWSWSLDREFAPEELFFRATEEDANGVFDTDRGFGQMTAQEREHGFDFQLKFATSVWSKEAKKQYMLQLYQLSVANPIIATNPRALWMLLSRLWEAFGEQNFRDIIPEPPQPDEPRTPKTEWAMLQRGEEVEVNPLDDDLQHLVDHRRRLENEAQLDEEDRDRQLEAMAVAHIMAHEQQRRQKMLLQAVVQRAMLERQQAQPTAQANSAPTPAPAIDSPAGAPQQQPGPQQPGPTQAVASAGPGGVGGPMPGI